MWLTPETDNEVCRDILSRVTCRKQNSLFESHQLLPAGSCRIPHYTDEQRRGNNLKTITHPTINLKTVILTPLALALLVLAAGFSSAYFDQEKEFTKEYSGTLFSSVPRILASVIRSDTDTLSAALELIIRDDLFQGERRVENQEA